MSGARNFYVLILLGTVLLVVQWYIYNKPKAAERRPTPYTVDVTSGTRSSASTHSTLWTKKVQLCVMFNLNRMTPNEKTINLLLTYYSRIFNHIMLLFDGKWKKPSYLPNNVTFSDCNSERGWYEHKCLCICLNETWGDSRPEGYLFIADDMFINLARMSLLPLSRIWYLDAEHINYTDRASLVNVWQWNRALKPLEVVIERLPPEWMDIIVKKVGFPGFVHARGTADLVYVPYSLAGTVTDVLTFITRTAQLISEVALPLAMDIVAPTDQAHFIYGYTWDGRQDISRMEIIARKAHFVHPIKLSGESQVRLWKTLMEEQLKNLSAG